MIIGYTVDIGVGESVVGIEAVRLSSILNTILDTIVVVVTRGKSVIVLINLRRRSTEKIDGEKILLFTTITLRYHYYLAILLAIGRL